MVKFQPREMLVEGMFSKKYHWSSVVKKLVYQIQGRLFEVFKIHQKVLKITVFLYLQYNVSSRYKGSGNTSALRKMAIDFLFATFTIPIQKFDGIFNKVFPCPIKAPLSHIPIPTHCTVYHPWRYTMVQALQKQNYLFRVN